VLLLAWLSASVALWRFGPDPPLELPATELGRARHALRALLHLVVVGAGAGVTVLGVIELAALLGVPEYLISFFGASIGTSMPELVVDLTAIRRGEHAIAIGDIIGASLIDATLSIGAGPLVAPTAVSAELGIRGSVVAAAAVLLATAMLTVTRRHGRRTGLVLLACYAAIYPLLLVD
jgi:cation:H+ antiporter